MANKTLHNKKRLLEALEKALGVVTTACNKVGLSRVTYYDYYNNDAEFRKSVDELSDVALDFGESQLHSKMRGVVIGQIDKDGEVVNVYSREPSDASIIFYLKTKGKHRGYIESTRVEYTNNTPAPVTREEVEESIKRLNDAMNGKLTVTKKAS